MTGVASRTASHVQVARGSSEGGIVHDVQPRSAICSSQSSFAMLPRPYATISARKRETRFGRRDSSNAVTISNRPCKP
jgi:hypothetical protein